MELKDHFPYPEVHNNLVGGYSVSYSTEDGSRAITNGIFIYEDDNIVSKALDVIFINTYRERIDTPPIGNESWAISRETLSPFDLSMQYWTMVAWRTQKSVVYVSINDTSEIPIEETIRLAQLVQSRIEGINNTQISGDPMTLNAFH